MMKKTIIKRMGLTPWCDKYNPCMLYYEANAFTLKYYEKD